MTGPARTACTPACEEDAAFAAWTQRHLDRMSGVTFAEAVRRLPPEQAAPLRALYPRRARR